MPNSTAEISSLRALTPEEMELVAGGTGTTNDGYGDSDLLGGPIVVHGLLPDQSDWQPDPLSDPTDFMFIDSGEFYGGDQDSNTQDPADFGNGMSPEQANHALHAVEATLAAAHDALMRWGPGSVQDANGHIAPLVDLIDGLEKLSGWIQAGTLVWGLSTGDTHVTEAVGIVFGMITAAAAADAGAPLLGAAAIGWAAEHITEGVLTTFATVYNGVADHIDVVITDFVQDHPLPGDNNNPYDFFRGLFHAPDPFRSGGDQP